MVSSCGSAIPNHAASINTFTGEEEERRRRKKMTIFDFFKILFLGFYKAELESASIKLSWNQRTYLYSVGSGLSIDIHSVDLEVSYDVISPLPIALSKHFNHLHPYIEIATAISDVSINLIEHHCNVTPLVQHAETKLLTCTVHAVPYSVLHLQVSANFFYHTPVCFFKGNHCMCRAI